MRHILRIFGFRGAGQVGNLPHGVARVNIWRRRRGSGGFVWRFFFFDGRRGLGLGRYPRADAWAADSGWEHGGPEWERISVPATECSRISPELLAEESAKDDETYRREYLCEFGEMEGAAFSRESIDAMLQDFEALSL
jgi:hypothetical protein